MNGLNWFQAKGLAMLQKRAIRQPNWRKWLLYRDHLWIVSEIVDGKEKLRIATNADLASSQYLAKDWTDEVWEGGTFPPCTNQGESTGLAGNPTGGGGTFTLTDFCGGAGNGGGVPMETGPGISEPPVPALTLALIANSNDTTLEPLTPDGVGCWTTPPASFFLVMGAKALNGVIAGAWFQYALDGDSLAGELAYGETHANAFFTVSISGAYLFGLNALGEDWVGVRSLEASYVPGATITVRADVLLEGGQIVTEFASLTLPDNCA